MNPKQLIDSILSFASKEGFPDIHINSDEKVKIRNKSGEIESLDSIIVDEKNVNLPILSKIAVK
jgi:Tfp pilus assembly pilus retraction ATPase PilT